MTEGLAAPEWVAHDDLHPDHARSGFSLYNMAIKPLIPDNRNTLAQACGAKIRSGAFEIIENSV